MKQMPCLKALRIAASLALLLLATSFVSLHAQTSGKDDFVPRVHGKLPYRLLQPQNYDTSQKYPLVIFFHGAGERGTDNKKQLVHGTSLFLKPEVREKFPCFVFAPQCPENEQWVDMPWGGDSGTQPEKASAAMTTALEALAELVSQFSIDTNRLYVTGLSMGGYGTWDCITRFPGRFAAAAPVCGGGDEKTVTAAVAKTPVWAFHSEDDSVVKVIRTRKMVEAMRQAGGSPKYYEYVGLGHFSWGKAYGEPELLPWLFAQVRGQPDTFVLKRDTPDIPPVARFPEDAAFPGEGPIRKMDWFKKLYVDRRLRWWNNREQDKGAVVFLGDSITQGWGNLVKAFEPMKVANRGISGDVTRGVLYRLKEDLLDLNPSAVVLLIGTNDLEEKGEPEVIAGNIKLMLARFKAFNPKMPVIVCKVMPSHASKSRPAGKIQKLNELVDALVKGDTQFIPCDTYSIFADENGNAKKSEFPDLLHPNAAGYAQWEAALKPIFANLNLTK